MGFKMAANTTNTCVYKCMEGPCDMLNAKCLLQINFETGSVMDIECILFYNV